MCVYKKYSQLHFPCPECVIMEDTLKRCLIDNGICYFDRCVTFENAIIGKKVPALQGHSIGSEFKCMKQSQKPN